MDNTSALPIVPGKSTNFLVAGMLPNTTYLIRSVNNGVASAPLTFTTGSLPSDLAFPKFTVLQPPAAGTDLTQTTIYHTGGSQGAPNQVDVLSTNLAGQINWYYDPVVNNFGGFAPTILPGGTVLMLGGGAGAGAGGGPDLRQINLAGEPLRETNFNAVNAQLVAMGDRPIDDFTHDAMLLPNGDTVVLATDHATINLNGVPTRSPVTRSSSSTRTSRLCGTGMPSTSLTPTVCPPTGERPTG